MENGATKSGAGLRHKKLLIPIAVLALIVIFVLSGGVTRVLNFAISKTMDFLVGGVLLEDQKGEEVLELQGSSQVVLAPDLIDVAQAEEPVTQEAEKVEEEEQQIKEEVEEKPTLYRAKGCPLCVHILPLTSEIHSTP